MEHTKQDDITRIISILTQELNSPPKAIDRLHLCNALTRVNNVLKDKTDAEQLVAFQHVMDYLKPYNTRAVLSLIKESVEWGANVVGSDQVTKNDSRNAKAY